MFKPIISLLIMTAMFSSCTENREKEKTYQQGTFGYDLGFLRQRDSVIILKNGEAEIIISPKYQAKVFTSTADGPGGSSFGWVNYKAFDGPPDPHMNAYGGENRLWLGPEGNRFSLFFERGSEQVFGNWKVPSAFDIEPWELKDKSDTIVRLSKEMHLTNYAGTRFSLIVNRQIGILGMAAIKKLFDSLSMGTSVKVVGYETRNSIINIGGEAWEETRGAPCIWMLDMFPPSAHAVIVVPYHQGAEHAVTSDYFGQVPQGRLLVKDGLIFFKADGKERGKIGVSGQDALNIAGSYDLEKKLLTVMIYNSYPNVGAKFLNQQWASTRPPYAGDALNAYNDGPLADGKQMGPFYEIESVSPAAFLKPGESLSHRHVVLHFTGEARDLDAIARETLGTTLEKIDSGLK